jgi:hypothetical protein
LETLEAPAAGPLRRGKGWRSPNTGGNSNGSWIGHFCSVASAILVLAGGFSAPAQPANPGDSRDFSAFKIVVDRNIFDPNRRPRVASGPAPTIVDSFSLVGTMSYQKGVFAVFDGTSSEYHKVLQPGGGIAGYTVKVIGQDTATLASGTNELELSVGMQMRRNEDGRWSVGEQGESAGGSYASISRGRRPERRAGASNPGSPAAEASNPDQVESAPDAGTPPPPGPASSDPNDPVARMMARRLQETGGNAGSPQNGDDN